MFLETRELFFKATNPLISIKGEGESIGAYQRISGENPRNLPDVRHSTWSGQHTKITSNFYCEWFIHGTPLLIPGLENIEKSLWTLWRRLINSVDDTCWVRKTAGPRARHLRECITKGPFHGHRPSFLSIKVGQGGRRGDATITKKVVKGEGHQHDSWSPRSTKPELFLASWIALPKAHAPSRP